MSVYRTIRLFCDGRSEPTEALPHGIPCSKEFHPQDSFGSSAAAIRQEARKAGWTYVRHPRARILDHDFCPKHKPAPEVGAHA